MSAVVCTEWGRGSTAQVEEQQEQRDAKHGVRGGTAQPLQLPEAR